MKQQLEAIRKAALDAISDAGKAEDIEGDWYKGVADKLETL